MLFSPAKCPLPALVSWCRTLNHSLGAGLDPRRVFRQQAKSGPRPLRGMAAAVADRLDKGDSLEDAFEPHRDRFPPLFVELVAVGERSGRLQDAFRELEAYFETTYQVRTHFRSQMVYPAIQFVVAVLVIALLIFVLGMLGSTMDPTGTGLKGTRGAVTFLVVAFGVVGGVVFAFKMATDSIRWRARLEGYALIVPVWGGALKSFALHRFCIALRMTHEAGLRADQSLKYSFRATANAAFLRGEAHAVAVVKKGGELGDALAASGSPFPEEFRDAIEVAEESGQVSEVAERLSENYREEGARRLKAAAEYTSYAIYGLVAIFIIICIFRIAGLYIGALDNAGKGL